MGDLQTSGQLPAIKRHITEHSEAGKAIFYKGISESMEWQEVGSMAKFGLAYTTSKFPPSFAERTDIQAYRQYLQNAPGIVIPNGTVLRVVDVPPLSESPMHRTVSLDYGVIIEGEFSLDLDSGESRILRRGDIAVQRGTAHSWKNTSDHAWGRLLFVLQSSEPLQLGGEGLGEDYGSGMPGVRASA